MNNLYLNFLSFLSVFCSFALNIFLGRQFKLSSNLDLYFATGSLIVYFGYIVQIFYESFAPYYADLVTKSKEESYRFYSVLLNQTIIAAIVIIIILQFFSGAIARYFFKSDVAEPFFRVFTLSLVFQNIDFINRGILNMNFKFAITYITSILYSVLNLVLIYALKPYCGIMSLAYACIISYCIIILLEAIYIKRSLAVKYFLIFNHERTIDVLKGSLWIKAGSMLYGAKDIIISKVLLGIGPGTNSIYTYASKFANAVYSIINAPTISIYASEITYRVVQEKLSDISKYTTKVIKKLFILFIPSVILGFFCMPEFLKITMKLEREVAVNIRNTFLVLCVLSLIITIDTCYAKIVTAFKRFDLTFVVNCVFFICFILAFLMLKINIIGLIFSMCIAQLFNLCMYVIFASNLLKRGVKKRMKFSVITPTYNRAFVIERAIKSMLKQSYPNWELIIVDDGSNDNTQEIISKYTDDHRIKYVSYGINRGVNYARNRGIEQATGDVITFLDSDDEFFEYTLERARYYIERYSEIDVFAFSTINENGEKKCWIKYAVAIASYGEILSGKTAFGEFLQFARRKVFVKYLFTEGLNGFEGITWLKISKEFRYIFIDEVLRIYWNDTESLIRYTELTEERLVNLKNGLELKLLFFGSDLKKYNKRGVEGFAKTLAVLGMANILLGNRKEGLKQSLIALKSNVLELTAWKNFYRLIKGSILRKSKTYKSGKVSVGVFSTISGNSYKAPQMEPLAKALIKRYMLSTIYCLYSKDNINIDKRFCSIFRLPQFIIRVAQKTGLINIIPGYYPRLLSELVFDMILYFRLKRDKSDILYTSPRNNLSIQAAKKSGKKVILEMGEMHPRYTSEVVEREYIKYGIKHHYIYDSKFAVHGFEKSISLADYIITLSEGSRKSLYEKGVNKPIFVSHLGVGSVEIGNEYDASKPFVFVSTAYHSFVKGTHNLLLAWRSAKIEDAVLVLVGDLHKDIKEFIIRYGPFDNVEYVGHKNIHEYYKQVNAVGVLASLAEGYPRAVIEYMQHGFPVIVTSMATCDIVESGKHGVIVEPNDIDRLASALKYFNNHRSEVLDMGRYAKKQIMNINTNEYTDTVLEIIDEISSYD